MREVVLLKVRLEALGEGGGSRSNTPTCRFQDERSSPLICLKMRDESGSPSKDERGSSSKGENSSPLKGESSSPR